MRSVFTAVATTAALVLGAAGTAAAGEIFLDPFAAPGTGFDDHTPVQPVGGNPGTTLGDQRIIVFLQAAAIWQETLNPNEDIYIAAQFAALGEDVLGSAGATHVWRNTPGTELPETWYAAALADHLAGEDLDPTLYDIVANFSSDFDFYLGLDGNEGPGQEDLLVVALHEIGHGLGFANFANETAGTLFQNFPDVYTHYTLDVTTGKTWSQMTDTERQASAVNVRKVSWNGLHVNRYTKDVLDRGEPGLKITSPAVLGTMMITPANFGPAFTAKGVSGSVVLADDGVAPGSDACTPLVNRMRGKIALVDRGSCDFTLKVKNAQNAGAIGVIVADNAPGGPPPALGGEDATIQIPSGRIRKIDGDNIKSNLGKGVKVKMFLDNAVYAGTDRVQGKMMLAAYDPVIPGSSISHFEALAFPNQIMEPAINLDLEASVTLPGDLTTQLMTDIGWFSDHDGVQDGEDSCLGSDIGETVVLGKCDSGALNLVQESGCSVADTVNSCAPLNERSHAAYVACVTVASTLLKVHGAITNADRRAILACAIQNKAR